MDMNYTDYERAVRSVFTSHFLETQTEYTDEPTEIEIRVEYDRDTHPHDAAAGFVDRYHAVDPAVQRIRDLHDLRVAQGQARRTDINWNYLEDNA